MKPSTLYVMFALVLLAGGAALLVSRGGHDTPTAADPLSSIDFASIRSLACRRADGTQWRLERDGERFRLHSSSFREDSVVANEELRERMLGFLKDMRPIASVAAADVDLGAWGIAPPELVLAIDDGREHEIELGREDLNNEVFYRRSGAATLFKTMEHTVADFRLDPQFLRSPRLVDLDVAQVLSFRLAGPERSIELERVADRWFLVRGGLKDRADRTRADDLLAGLLEMKGKPVGREAAGFSVDAAPPWTASFRTYAGGETRFFIQGIDDQRGDLYASREDERELRQVSRTFGRFLERRPEELLDLTLVSLAEAELARIQISGPERSRPLLLEQTTGRWLLSLERGPARVEQEAFNAFRDGLLGMRVREFLASAPEFEPALVVRYELATETGSPPIVVRFSPPRDDGSRFAVRSDQRGGAIVEAAATAVLGTRYWDLLIRHVATGHDARIDRVAVTLEDGAEYRLERLDRGDGRAWEWEGRVIPDEVLQGLMNKLTFLSVESYVGEETEAAAAAFAKPKWRIEWNDPDPRAPIPPGEDRPDTDRIWEVGRLIGDTHYECRIDTYPGLVFRVPGETFIGIQDLVRTLERLR